MASLLLSGAANAADLYGAPASRQAPRLGGYSWTGPYVGANLGGQWSSVTNSGADPWGAAGGVQIGHSWQLNQFVFGAETDFQIAGGDDTFAAWKFSNPWFGTVRGRVGIAINNVMFYGTGGFAYGSLRARNLVTGASEAEVLTGYAVGGGLEVALAGQWTARAEYLYIDLGATGFGVTGASHGLESSLVRLGVNYRF